MPTPDFVIKAGDTFAAITDTLTNSGGTAVDIQDATVLFKMAAIAGGTTVVAAEATNAQVGAGTTDGSTGMVAFTWGTSDTATAGLFLAEWEVTFTGGSIGTFPNNTYLLVKVMEDL